MCRSFVECSSNYKCWSSNFSWCLFFIQKYSTDYNVYKCFTLFLCITIKNRLNDNKAYKTLKFKWFCILAIFSCLVAWNSKKKACQISKLDTHTMEMCDHSYDFSRFAYKNVINKWIDNICNWLKCFKV